jgi:hypothetical protein
VGVYLLSKPPTSSTQIEVEFILKEMKSCPEHIAWLLVNITGTEDYDEALTVSIQTNQSIHHEHVLWSTSFPQLLEVFLYPNASHVNSDIEVEVQVTADSFTATDSAVIHVIEWEIHDMNYITEFRDVFINYLMVNHPEFKIDETVKWTTIQNSIQILIVEHFLFMSESWEMELSRHVMIAPYDWVEVYLRPRGALTPTWAGEIESWSTNSQLIQETDPPDQIYRARGSRNLMPVD